MGKQWSFRQSLLARALRGAEEGGMTVVRIVIDPETGKIVLSGPDDRDAPEPNPWDVDLPK